MPWGHRLISILINQFRLGESPGDGKVSDFVPSILVWCAHEYDRPPSKKLTLSFVSSLLAFQKGTAIAAVVWISVP